MPLASRRPYAGSRRKISLFPPLDGTDLDTFSILDPGVIPVIKFVTRFPAQEHVGGDTKIPSIIYYDEAGIVRGVGAEALELKDWVLETDSKWFLVEWFKLHMRPFSLSNIAVEDVIPALPPDKTALQVFGDFLKYLFQCAESYIQETNRLDFWSSIQSQIDFVLPHPNGWGHFKGSIFVIRNARVLLEHKLNSTRFEGDIDEMVYIFDVGGKTRFRSAEEPVNIRFGSIRERDLAPDIRNGQIKLTGADVATFFEPSIRVIIQSVLEQQRACVKLSQYVAVSYLYTANTSLQSIFFVGGFAASEYMFSQLQKRLGHLKFCRPESHVNKAAVDGAVSFYLDRFVTKRMSRATYGIQCSRLFNPDDRAHASRVAEMYTSRDGEQRIPSAFSVILPKDTVVAETKEFRQSYFRQVLSPIDSVFRAEILSYEG
ncbi:hypothetical protein C8J56DRAFT_1060374 [Mycena floridula]|nr:hypothetical protein C8J56DRAFT_1060374 [Mycena floridula]